MSQVLFYFLSFITLVGAVMVIFSKNPIHSVLYLILTFFSLSGHYILLNAQFIAAVNIIVYAGAIMVLFLFVIMFLNFKKGSENIAPLFTKGAAVILGGILLVIFTGVVKSVETDLQSTVSTIDEFRHDTGLVETLGNTLFIKFLVPFELTSILFIAALVGAVMLGKREPGESNNF